MQQINELNIDKFLALAMGRHARPGARFAGKRLSEDELTVVTVNVLAPDNGGGQEVVTNTLLEAALDPHALMATTL
jgi:hypothetical protein